MKDVAVSELFNDLINTSDVLEFSGTTTVRDLAIVELLKRFKTVDIDRKNIKWLGEVKKDCAADLDMNDMKVLINWCEWQDGSLWDDMSVQEILNVYRVSCHYDTWQSWYEVEPKQANVAWNSAVIDPGNMMDDFTK